MQQLKKILLAVIIIGMLGASLGIAIYTYNHTNEEPVPVAKDANSDRDYALVDATKGDFEVMDSHTFLETVQPILNAYNDKLYTTFMFEDGTGIYFPFSDTSNVAQYCEVDECGRSTALLGDITISGTTITYTETPVYQQKETMNAYQYIPDEYMNDDFALCIEDGVLYAAIGSETVTDEDAANKAITFCKSVMNKADGDLNVTKAEINLSDFCGVEVNLNTYETRIDYSIVEIVTEKTH